MEQQSIPGIKDQPGPALGELISQISIDSANFHWKNNFQRLSKREKNVKTQEFNKAIEDAVIECFQSVPFLAIMEMDVESDLPDLRPDIQLTLKIKDKIKHIVKFRRKNWNTHGRIISGIILVLLLFHRFAKPNIYTFCLVTHLFIELKRSTVIFRIYT